MCSVIAYLQQFSFARSKLLLVGTTVTRPFSREVAYTTMILILLYVHEVSLKVTKCGCVFFFFAMVAVPPALASVRPVSESARPITVDRDPRKGAGLRLTRVAFVCRGVEAE